MAGMRRSLSRPLCAIFLAFLPLPLLAGAQQERHGRNYKAPPPTAAVVISVEKATNGKPLSNASVIFRATRNDEKTANLEMKTDPDGHASMDLLEVGSHVTVQVIADGFATYATDFGLSADGKQMLIKMQRPRAQVSTYGDGSDRPAESKPGVQEHVQGAEKPYSAPVAPPPTSPSPTTPLQTIPPVNPPATVPGNSTTPPTPGSPQ